MPVLSLALIFCFNDLNGIVMSLFEKAGLGGTFIEFSWNTPGKLILALAVIALLPALIEELFMRGYVLGGMKHYSPLSAAFISALLFSILHMNVMQFLYQFMLGAVLGILVQLSARRDYGILLHFLNNGIVIVITYCAGGETDAVPPALDAGYVAQAVLLSAAGVLAAGACIFIFARFMLPKKAKETNAKRSGGEENGSARQSSASGFLAFLKPKETLLFMRERLLTPRAAAETRAKNRILDEGLSQTAPIDQTDRPEESPNAQGGYGERSFVRNRTDPFSDANAERRALIVCFIVSSLIWIINFIATIYMAG
jgi:hypothetical protein